MTLADENDEYMKKTILETIDPQDDEESPEYQEAKKICWEFLAGKIGLSQLGWGLAEPAPSSPTPARAPAWCSLGDAVGSVMSRIEQGEEVGIINPYPSLRPYIGDFAQENVIVVSGYTGHGKTALAMNIALRVAEEHTVKLFSLEMSKEELALRALAILSGVNSNSIRHRMVPQEKLDDLAQAVLKAESLKLSFDDHPRSTMDHLEQIVREDPPEFLVVDHVHMMGAGNSNRTQDVGDMARRFKDLARETKSAILLLAQLRKADPRSGGTKTPPTKEDLKDSADLMQAANSVLLVHKKDDHPKTIQVVIDKQRSGATGSIDLLWEPELTRMRDPVEGLG